MKVKTLIELLSKCDPESLVITEDGEGNVFDTTNVEINGGEVQIMYGNGDTTYNDDLPEERKIRSYYPSYDSEYDSEIAETLRLAGVQLNENSDSFYASCIAQDIELHPDSNIYIKPKNNTLINSKEELENIIQYIEYIMKKYNVNEIIAIEVYENLSKSKISFSDLLKIYELLNEKDKSTEY